MPANVSSEYVSQALCQTLQTTKINFEKLLGYQVFNTHNFNPFQSTYFKFDYQFLLMYLLCYL